MEWHLSPRILMAAGRSTVLGGRGSRPVRFLLVCIGELYTGP